MFPETPFPVSTEGFFVFHIFASFVDATPYDPTWGPVCAALIFGLLGILSFVDNAKNKADKIVARYAADIGMDPNTVIITIGSSPRQPSMQTHEPEAKAEPVAV